MTRLLSSLQLENLTSTQIAALATGTGRYPAGSVVYDTTLKCPRVNLGTDAAQVWGFFGDVPIFDVVVGRGNTGDPAAPASIIDSNTILGGNIPQDFRHLLLVGSQKCTAANSEFDVRFNNDSSLIYDAQNSQAHGATLLAGESIAQAQGFLGNSGAFFTSFRIDIPDYKTAGPKSYVCSNHFRNGAGSNNQYFQDSVGYWPGAAAVTRLQVINLTSSWVAGSRYTLYGRP